VIDQEAAMPTDAPTIFPGLRYADAPAALEWLARAFGFEEVMAVPGPDGTIVHAEMRLGRGMIMLGSDKDDRFGSRAGMGWIYVALDGDIDAHHDRAVAAGAEVIMELTDTDYGSRDYSVKDLEGNMWSFGTYRPALPD
jgi:uncharacterized glyoxalase superfamily protein PhnB